MKKKAKGGRPPKKYGRKSRLLAVKTTPEQRDEYERAADAVRVDLSEWVRSVLDDAARKVLGDG